MDYESSGNIHSDRRIGSFGARCGWQASLSISGDCVTITVSEIEVPHAPLFIVNNQKHIDADYLFSLSMVVSFDSH